MIKVYFSSCLPPDSCVSHVFDFLCISFLPLDLYTEESRPQYNMWSNNFQQEWRIFLKANQKFVNYLCSAERENRNINQENCPTLNFLRLWMNIEWMRVSCLRVKCQNQTPAFLLSDWTKLCHENKWILVVKAL